MAIDKEIFDHTALLVEKYKTISEGYQMLVRSIANAQLIFTSVSKDDPLWQAYYEDREKVLNLVVEAASSVQEING